MVQTLSCSLKKFESSFLLSLFLAPQAMEARCQCLRIQFTTPLPQPTKVYVCHCNECRHQSSSAYGLTAIFPSFEIADPNPKITPGQADSAIGIYTRRTLRGRNLECLFCRNCGARLIHRVRGECTLSVRAGCLVGLTRDMITNATHIWCSEAVVEIPPGVERWDKQPGE